MNQRKVNALSETRGQKKRRAMYFLFLLKGKYIILVRSAGEGF